MASTDIIIPDTSGFDIDADKPSDVIEQETEQQAIERGLKVESNLPKFYYIRKHFEELIELYSDSRHLIDTPHTGMAFEVFVRVKAGMAEELQTFLQMIDQVNEVDEDARE